MSRANFSTLVRAWLVAKAEASPMTPADDFACSPLVLIIFAAIAAQLVCRGIESLLQWMATR